jgi:hypothetical protein
MELARGAFDLARFAARERTLAFEWNWLAMRTLHATLFEELSMISATADLRAGAPIVFIDFIAYDEAAHRRGPDHPVALEQLARIDGRIGQLARVAAGRGYEVLVCSDHGQAAVRPFARVTGRTLAATVFAACGHAGASARFAGVADRLDAARVRAARVRKWPGLLGRASTWQAQAVARRAAGKLERRFGVPAGELAVVTGGSIAHVYVGRRAAGSTLEEIRARFPRLVPALLESPGVGLLVARRTARGPEVYWRGEAASLHDEDALAMLPPFRQTGVSALAAVIRRVVAASTAGDLVLYGAFAAAGPVSFEPELGSHGGIHPDELDLFVLEPAGFDLPAGLTLDPADLGAALRARFA